MADDRSNPKNWLGPYADSEQDWLALRAAERPAYLASALAEYLELREWTPEQLADRLRCAPEQLAKLGLCRRPDLSAELHQQVSQIASRFDLDYWSLRRLLEELALEPGQRQRYWQTERFFDQPAQGSGPLKPPKNSLARLGNRMRRVGRTSSKTSCRSKHRGKPTWGKHRPPNRRTRGRDSPRPKRQSRRSHGSNDCLKLFATPSHENNRSVSKSSNSAGIHT